MRATIRGVTRAKDRWECVYINEFGNKVYYPEQSVDPIIIDVPSCWRGRSLVSFQWLIKKQMTHEVTYNIGQQLKIIVSLLLCTTKTQTSDFGIGALLNRFPVTRNNAIHPRL